MSFSTEHLSESARIKEYNIKKNLYHSRDPDRYYLEEYFKRLPATNGALAPSSAGDGVDGATATEIATMMAANKDFELQGTNHATGTVAFNSARAGINIQTSGNGNDQMIIAPHQDTNQTAWKGVTWRTDDELVWECAIRTGSYIDNMVIWAGLKESNVPGFLSGDTDQAYFLYASDDTKGTLTTNANLHFVYSVNNTDYVTDLDIALAVETIYKLKIIIDKDRKVSVYVNGKVYGLSTSDTGGGATQNNAGQKSLALRTARSFIPFIGIEGMGGMVRSIDVYYQKISRTLE